MSYRLARMIYIEVDAVISHSKRLDASLEGQKLRWSRSGRDDDGREGLELRLECLACHCSSEFIRRVT